VDRPLRRPASGAAHRALSLLARLLPGDLPFIGLLNSVRVGVCTPETTAELAACHIGVKPQPDDGNLLPQPPPNQPGQEGLASPSLNLRTGILPTKLYCKNLNVDAENAARLAELPGAATSFAATDLFKVPLPRPTPRPTPSPQPFPLTPRRLRHSTRRESTPPTQRSV